MVADKTPRTKTQTLSLRLDPKTRFVLEFLAKLNRQSITTVVEEAIRREGARRLLDPLDKNSKTWRDFWDVSDGVREMKLLAEKEFPSDYEDDELRDFIEWHIEFFSETNELKNPDRINVEILWPEIQEYLNIWRKSRGSDPWVVGEEMADAISNAGVEPPKWPRATKEPPPPRPSLGDEIPF